MATNTSIEWTDSTWNPIIGCSRVSEGCRNCYAEGIAARFVNTSGPYSGLTRIVNGHPQWTGKISETKQLLDPLRWRKPRRVFVNSMSDLFHENVTDEVRDRIFAVMALCPQHTFQVLTKRPERMRAYLTASEARKGIARATNLFMRSDRRAGDSDALAHVFLWSSFENAEVGEYANYLSGIADRCWPLPNVWLGVSVENQATADERIPLLLQTPAAKRFISAEPLLGEVNLGALEYGDEDGEYLVNALTGVHEVLHSESVDCISDDPDNPKLDWVIVGGESGPGARPMHPDWVRSLRDQCSTAGVPFFFKQWGEWLPSMQDGTPGYNQEINYSDRPVRVGKKAAGALLDGCEWREFPR